MTQLNNFYQGLEKFVSPLVEGEIKGGKFSLKARPLDADAKVKAAFHIIGLFFLNIVAIAAFALLCILRAKYSKNSGNDPAAPPAPVPAPAPVVPASTVVSIAPSLSPATVMAAPTGEGNSSIPKPQDGMAPPVCFKESKPLGPVRAKRRDKEPAEPEMQSLHKQVETELTKRRASMHGGEGHSEFESDDESDDEPGFDSN